MYFYYKTKTGNNYLKLKSQVVCDDYEEITEEEFNTFISQVSVYETSEKDEKIARINELKTLLNNSDYKVLKHIEGQLSDEDYQEIVVARAKWREEINLLEIEVQDNE